MSASLRSNLAVCLLALAAPSPGQQATGTAGTEGCSPRAFPGDLICVCGQVSGPVTERVLKLDGRPAGEPVAAVPGAVFFRLPQDTAPGMHEVAVQGAEGGPCLTEVLWVLGEVDRDKLRRGQSTPLRLEIRGTREPVTLRLQNLTPAIVSLEGGNDQQATSSGGAKNVVERRVRGLSPGDFDIRYELTAPPCPCGEFPGDGVFTEPQPQDPAGGEPERPTVPEPPPQEPPDVGEPQRPTVPEPPELPPVTTPGGEPQRPTVPEPPELPPVTTPGGEPTAPPEEGEPPCASIGEEIERLRERTATLTEELPRVTVPVSGPGPGVTTTGPTGHVYCDRSYTTWQAGAQAVSIHRMLNDVQELASFCLGHGTCTPEGHRAYSRELEGLAAKLGADPAFAALAEEMPPLAESLLREYRFELGQDRARLRELRAAAGAGAAPETAELRRELREAELRVRSDERLIESMESWRAWSRELVEAIDRGALLAGRRLRKEQEGSR